MAKTIAHDKALERGAVLRAILMAYLNSVDTFVSVADVRKALKDELEGMKVNDVALATQLRSLAGNNLIVSKRDGVRNLYTNLDVAKTKSKTKVDIKIKPLKAGIIPAYKIDVVKGQKRVRITIDDVMFDIGVVNG